MKTLFFFLLIIISFSKLQAQIGPIPCKFGKISKEELEMKSYPKDSTSSALVLYNFGTVSFDVINGETKVIYDKHVRIKLFNHASFRYGEVEIPYFIDADHVITLEASTYNQGPDGKAIETRVNKNLFFDEDINGYMHKKKFTFPELKDGSIIEYTYTMRSENLFELKRFSFQYEIPVQWSEYRTNIPEPFTYYTVTRGATGMSFVEHGNSVLNLYYASNQYGNTNVNETRYVMKDVPALSEEPFSFQPESYFSSMSMQLNHISFPQFNKPVVKDWEAFSDFTYTSDFFGSQLRHYAFAKDVLAGIISNTDNDKEKLIKIYNYVKNNFSWNGYRSFYIHNLKKTFDKKSGNGCEINSLLICLLRDAGINAEPVILCTRDYGELQEVYPLLSGFNHVIAKASIDSTSYFLDATDPDRPYSIIDYDDLNVRAFAFEGKKWKWIKIQNNTVSRSVYNYNLAFNEALKITGKVSYLSNAYNCLEASKKIKERRKNELMSDLLSSESFNIKLDSVTITKFDSVASSINMNAAITYSPSVEGKFIYLTPLINGDLHKNPFRKDTRNLPIEFEYPENKSYTFSLQIPPGYKVNELPKNIKVSLANNGASFTFLAQEENNVVQMKSTLNIDRIFYNVNEYDEVKEFFANISKIFSQQIVLEKI